MHPYRVKEYLWLVILLMFVIALAGCSSPKIQAQKPQYCHTSQTIKTQNGERVNSETTLDCTDDQFKRLTAVRMGMASNCGISNKLVEIGGKIVNIQVRSCQVLDYSGNVIGYEYVH